MTSKIDNFGDMVGDVVNNAGASNDTFTNSGEIRQYHSMADSAPITMISGKMEKARLIMFPGSVTANGAAPPPM